MPRNIHSFTRRQLPLVFAALAFVGRTSATDLVLPEFPTPPTHLEQPDQPPIRVESWTTSPPAGLTRGLISLVQVNVDPMGDNVVGDAGNEPSIALDPTHPLRMAIAWRQFDTVLSNFRQAGYAYSRDGGRTWTFPGVLTPGTFRSDPVLASDVTGRFFYNSLRSNFLCDTFISTDGGKTWGSAIPAFGGDKAWIAVDTTGTEGLGNLYAAWSQNAGCCEGNTFTRSTDHGLTYSTPIEIPERPLFGTLDVGPFGELYVAGRLPTSSSQFAVAKSTDAQDPLIPGDQISFTTTQLNLNGTQGLGGNSPNPGGLLGQVNVVVDKSTGPTRGHVYVLCSVNPPGDDPMDVVFSRSTDGGQTWSPPIKVNNSEGAFGNAWQWFGTLSVAPSGRLDAVWNDTRESGLVNISETRYAFSTNGGQTWSASVALTPAWNSHVGWPNQNKIGDYYHMLSDNVGADLAMSATLNGEQDVYYVRIGEHDCNRNSIGDESELFLGAPDANNNGIIDTCEQLLGDMNCDGDVDVLDINPFVLAIADPAAYQAAFPSCLLINGDADGSGTVNVLDINAFVALLSG
ncbi:BNR/Asp-box repeat protein [Phycisphaerae bacterium RAS1]|nr:BNR/Asp-box repeat protein [Phycisphaerae bacterium RAS1]